MGILGPIPAAIGLLLALVTSGAAQHASAPRTLDAQSAFELSQDAIGTTVGPHVLRDQSGAPLALTDLLGKPLVISLIFTSCSSVCPVTTDHLRDAVIQARQILGQDSFNVLTFGFDASGDTPTQLTGFASQHRLRGIENWHLASADPETTEALLDDLGFSWRSAAASFDHITQTTVLDESGKVYRQIYGEAFPLPVFVGPLKDLVLGNQTRSADPADLWDRVVFLCTVYNPLTGAYRFDYGIFFGIFFGGLSLILTGIIILRLWLGNRRAARSGLGRSA